MRLRFFIRLCSIIVLVQSTIQACTRFQNILTPVIAQEFFSFSSNFEHNYSHLSHMTKEFSFFDFQPMTLAEKQLMRSMAVNNHSKTLDYYGRQVTERRND